MLSSRVTLAVRSAAFGQSRRGLATAAAVTAASRSHKVVVIGGGSAGLAISHQLLRSGRFASEDIAVVDPAQWHHYQPGWTLVGAGLKTKEELKMSMPELIDPKLKFYNVSVDALTPEDNSITLGTGDKVNYEHLVVAPGIKINYDSIKGLPEALAERNGPVSSIYGYDYCDKVFPNIQRLQKGNAIFTQPAGVIKCAGAPQKSMWLALDHWKQTGLYDPKNPSGSPIKITFATGLPVMFGVPKYSAELEKMRQERGVEGLFQHDLVAIEGNNAVFANGQDKVTRPFDFLHVVPKMGPHAFVKNSALANEAGYVDVNDNTLRHNKFSNVWSAGDASSLPTSKTAAAVTSEAPVLVSNLLRAIDGQEPEPAYDGYTSCPLLTEYGKVMLAEFKYGGVPKETFGEILGIDQAVPRRSFYHLKKDFFPWVYKNYMIKVLDLPSASFESYPWTRKSGFYLDAKALKLLHKIECLEHRLRYLRRRLDVNTRDLEKIDFYRTKAKLGWFGSLRRRLNEQLDHEKQRERQIDQIRTKLLEAQIPLDMELIASKEARLAKLQAEFESRIQWESKEAQKDYRKWLCDEKRREDAKNNWKMEQKRRDREKWEGKWQKFLLSEGAKKEVSRGHPKLWGSFLL
ncbi:sulfide:quinone oxidoreductase mitochondrial precursor [Fusarium acutatum]|uniref:Sulfide:quinone oxidoreductase mitochondrial n=1 Tax=Fusarium acutatum TaxID=78861 RepID=A0A8H4JE95_9HYPO|nr:sulfide:quinone oxidoreductase mitochondrial precursor [Fusarium acutatum]